MYLLCRAAAFIRYPDEFVDLQQPVADDLFYLVRSSIQTVYAVKILFDRFAEKDCLRCPVLNAFSLIRGTSCDLIHGTGDFLGSRSCLLYRCIHLLGGCSHLFR